MIKTLTIDIETSPHVVYKWGPLWKPESSSPDKLVAPGRVLCVAAKWLHESRVRFYKETDGDMIEVVRDLLDEADQVVHYNGIRFDIPKLNAEFGIRHLIKPQPFKHVDLSQIVQRTFDFPSGKLGYVAPALHLEEKAETGGFGLWLKVMSGDRKAWKKMRDYNIQDVVTTEALFVELRDHGWLSGKVINPGLDPEHYGVALACNVCGSDFLWKRGYRYSGQSRFTKYQCQDCGSYTSSTRADKTLKHKGV